MSQYDPLAFLVFVVALAVSVCALHFERDGRPKWQVLALFFGVIALMTLTAVLIHLGRKPYIPRVTSGVFCWSLTSHLFLLSLAGKGQEC